MIGRWTLMGDYSMNAIYKIICASLVLAGMASSGALLAADVEREFALGVNEANAKLRSGDIDGALQQYANLRGLQPESADLAYNMAVAQYRKGDVAAAEPLFQSAATSENDSLAAKARYNLGNCDYAAGLKLAQQDRPAAIRELESAIENYRSSLDVDTNNADARANIELASRLIDKLREEEKQEQQQQNQQNQQDNQQQSQDQQQQNNQQQNQNEQNQQEQQQQDQKNQQQNEQQQKQDEQSQDEQSNQQQSNDQQKQDQQNQQDSQSQSAQDKSQQEQQNEKSQPQDQEQKDQQQPDEEKQNQSQAEKSQDQQQQKSQQEQSKQDQASPQDQQQEQPSAQQHQPQDSQSQQQQRSRMPQRPQQPQDATPAPEETKEKPGQQPPQGELTAAGEEEKDGKEKRPIAAFDPSKDGAMTQEEAEKMLQAIRDREMLRRYEQRRQEMRQYIPVDRDW